MRVIGTAGHVDHGKSTLVEALTGIHPDRLKEEREREMTIDLGFAWLTLPNGEEVGIVDVPGHRDFIENMLAGVGGIDTALFVVAADEGVMPQTREHLAILDILQIQSGVVALTKTDLVDEDWLELVKDDLRSVLRSTVLEDAPLVPVSARTGRGLSELTEAVSESLASRPPRPDYGKPRLPIDRVFTMPGFGTVVTGTLSDGLLRVGDEIEILPAGLRGRVRGLQTHKRKEELAVPGGRTAVNISGITHDHVQRGDILAHPGDYAPSRRLDVDFRLLPAASGALKHNTEVKLFIGAAELVARVRLLGSEELAPGEHGWLQLETSQPVVAVRGDHYILRRPSPGETLGGGVVIDPHPKRRHKRFATETLDQMEALTRGTPTDILRQTLAGLGAAPLKEIITRSSLGQAAAIQAAQELVSTGQWVVIEGAQIAPEKPVPDVLVASSGFWQQLARQAIQEVENYHKAFSLRQGISREELKSRLRTHTRPSPRLFNVALARLVSSGELVESGPWVRRPDFSIRFNPQQQQAIDRLMARFSAAPFSPPSVKESQAEVGEEVMAAMLDLGQLIAVAPDVVFRPQDYQHMVQEVRRLLQEQGTITAAQVRDQLNTSRKYALALLEHLDSAGVTVRQGDFRKLRNP